MKRPFCAAALLAFALAGCHPEHPGVNPSPPAAPPPHPAVALPKPIPGQAVIYVVNPKATGDADPLMARTISLRQPDTPARSAVSALLADPNSPIPAGTSLRGIAIDNGVATLDFSRSPVNDTGGEGGQGNALTALGRTLGQFPEIQTFQIQIRGKLVKTFGEFTTDGPIEVTRPEAKS